MYAPLSPPDLPASAAQSALVAALCRPGAYARLHPVTAPIRCIETHVSWVFLTGTHAYKVKKPVRLSFLDYSTLKQREACCHEELRLNHRHAPELYLEVVAITGTPADPRVERLGAEAGAVIDYAVRMAQFDPEQELGHLLPRADVTADECAALGERIARMHEAAATVAGAATAAQAAFGQPEAVQRIVLANFDELARVETQLRDTAAWRDALRGVAIDALCTRAEQLYTQVNAKLQDRRNRDCVREGHGDLHCGNVVRWRDELIAFDGIEFDPALRWIDVASDLAFLTMDLSVRGRDELRRAVLQGWLTVSGDFDALALLDYFELYRALVRAKVAALRALQDRAVADASLDEARRYLAWAADRDARPAPTLVVMAGLSGSGKTWLAQRIGAQLDAVIVRSDVERKRLAGLQPLQASRSAPDAGLYSVEFNARTYARLFDCVDSALRGGVSIVVDAANLRRAERERFAALAREHGAGAAIVHCTAPLHVLRERVTARTAAGSDASEATAALLDRQPGYWEDFSADERKRVLGVDTTDDAAIERALAALATLHHDRAS